MTALAPLPRYVFRIAPEQYDRTPDLSPTERQVLSAWNTRRGYGPLKERLVRLYRPLADVLRHLQRDKHGSKRTLTFVLEEVRRTGSPYWAWDQRHWLGLLNSPDAKSGKLARPYLLATAYLLAGFSRAHEVEPQPSLPVAAGIIFGRERFEAEYKRLEGALIRLGYGRVNLHGCLPTVLAALMLEGRDPRLEAFDAALLERTRALHRVLVGAHVGKVSHGLAALGMLATPIRMRNYVGWREKSVEGIGQEWVAWCRRWRDTSTLRPRTRETNYSYMLRAGLWLSKAHPEIASPVQWTVEICADFLAVVDRLTVGEWVLSSSGHMRQRNAGKPMDANSKRVIYHAIRRFLSDVQLWEWAKLRCNPRHHLATPTSVLRLSGVNPRTIDDAVWLKLVWASLNLEDGDRLSEIHYPIELLRAVAVIWTHAGLRGNEILRLRQGCARAQDDAVVDEAGGVTPAGHDPSRNNGQGGQQQRRERQFVRLPRREGKARGATRSVGNHAGVAAIAAARPAQGFPLVALRRTPPFLAAPAALWCARMLVPSRNAMPTSIPPRCCAPSSSRSQAPRRAHLRKHCATIRHGPRSAGIWRHFAPLPWRQMIASIVRRRSWCSILCGGRQASIKGASTSHCASVKTFVLSCSTIRRKWESH